VTTNKTMTPELFLDEWKSWIVGERSFLSNKFNKNNIFNIDETPIIMAPGKPHKQCTQKDKDIVEIHSAHVTRSAVHGIGTFVPIICFGNQNQSLKSLLILPSSPSIAEKKKYTDSILIVTNSNGCMSNEMWVFFSNALIRSFSFHEKHIIIYLDCLATHFIEEVKTKLEKEQIFYDR